MTEEELAWIEGLYRGHEKVTALCDEVRRLQSENATLSRNLEQVIAKRVRETSETRADALRDAALQIRTSDDYRERKDRGVGLHIAATMLERMAEEAERD